MNEILHDLFIDAEPAEVFRAVSDPAGLDDWWTLTCAGVPAAGEIYRLGFGPEFQWEAVVSNCDQDSEFELKITKATDDWIGTRVGFRLRPSNGGTTLEFRHTGWAEASPHFRQSSYCWASYLRILKRLIEKGIRVPYQSRDAD